MTLRSVGFKLVLFFLWQLSQIARATPECDPNVLRPLNFRFPIIIKGQSWLVGRRIDQIESWAFKSGKWIKVPFQIDEVNSDGNYVLEDGIPYTKFTDDGLFDENDEFAIKGVSLGEAFTQKQISKSIIDPNKDYTRVDLCGAKSGYLGSILLVHRQGIAVSDSFTPLFDRSRGLIQTSKYKYAFRNDQPMMMGDVVLRTPEGEKPVFAASSFIMPLVPRFFIFPTLYFGENDFTSEIECWRSGPVRSIVAVGSKLRKFFRLLDLHLFSELVFYEDHFQIPTQIEFIFDPSNLLAKGSGISYILSYSGGVNWALKSNLERLPLEEASRSDTTKSAFDHSPDGLFQVRGTNGSGSFMANVRVDPKALKQAPPPYLVTERDFQDHELASNWPWLKKSSGSIAVFIDISGVRSGIYDFALDVALSNQAHDEFNDFQAVTAIWRESTAF